MTQAETSELIALWHTARIAGAVSDHERILWAAKEFAKTNGCPHLVAYKILSSELRGKEIA
ncbi:hypothetical protein LCGC14_2525170 [marine sediment metagenome]|uniref:Uncharacterized protein n=1 Tax=marine sediment metagenome TaxID=412755 RepID=A0A0F9DNF4_9ZZZZ